MSHCVNLSCVGAASTDARRGLPVASGEVAHIEAHSLKLELARQLRLSMTQLRSHKYT